jgi:penicillin-binding protein 1A
LPKNLVQTLVAQKTSVLNTQALTGGTLQYIANLGTSGGTSTLTQQLAKQLFHGEGSKCLLNVQKVKEWIIAIRLEGNILRMKS